MISRVLAILLVLATGALAQQTSDTRKALTAQIVASGFNEFGNTRHTVELRDCVLTALEWTLDSDGEWRLWRSLEWPMQLAEFDQDSSVEGQYFVHGANDDPALNRVVMFFRTEGAAVVKERWYYNHLFKALMGSDHMSDVPSITSHDTWGLIIHKGPDVELKAKEFTEGYLRYRKALCE